MFPDVIEHLVCAKEQVADLQNADTAHFDGSRDVLSRSRRYGETRNRCDNRRRMTALIREVAAVGETSLSLTDAPSLQKRFL